MGQLHPALWLLQNAPHPPCITPAGTCSFRTRGSCRRPRWAGMVAWQSSEEWLVCLLLSLQPALA